MIRAILRYVQNTLVISSALLVILAWQRMESFDYHNNQMHPYDHFSHQEDSGETFDSQMVKHHHGFLGRQFSVGLFRFVFPRLENVETALPAHDMIRHRDHSSISKEKREQVPSKKSVAFLLDIPDCTAPILDAAAVFQRSTSLHCERKNVQLHAVLYSSLVPVCGSSLHKMGYHTINIEEVHLPEALERFASDECISDETRILSYAIQLPVDTVVRTPLPSIVLPTQSRGNKAAQDQEGSLNKQEHSKTKESQGRELGILARNVNAVGVFANKIVDQCVKKSPSNETNFSPASRWKPFGSNYDLTEYGMGEVSTFGDCPVPWECIQEKEGTERKGSQCRALRHKWFELRYDIEKESQKRDHVVETASKVSSFEFLKEMYCRSGAEGYNPMNSNPVVTN